VAITYKDAGVDIDAGAALVERIGPMAKSTLRPEVVTGLGGFAGLCRLPSGYKNPLLVSGTDGVGTKLKTAFATGRHRTVGIDLVAMAVNDVIVIGAEPLFFLDYYATSRLDVDVAADVIDGIAEGCRQAGCALLGGETAEMPGFYTPGEYDLAGFCVGVVEADDVRDGRSIGRGDVLIGLASAGLHSNGHSLARKVILEVSSLAFDATPELLGGKSVADVLLEPTRIYVAALLALRRAGIAFKGATHITGGGLVENPPRMLHDDELAIQLDPATWSVPPVFELIAQGGAEESEMRRTFNMGLGMLVCVEAAASDHALKVLASSNERATVVGRVVARDGNDRVVFG